MSISLRLYRQKLRAIWEGCCTHRAILAGSISAALATLVLCLIYSIIGSSSMCPRISPAHHEAALHQGAVPSAAPLFMATHEPYSTEPPSFLASPRYHGICSASGPLQQECIIEPFNASSPGAAQPCSPGSLRQWDGTGNWFQGKNGHYRYEPSHCRLRRLDAQQARQCLNNKRLAWVGDSLTRYQYTSLAHFLARGVWPERYGSNSEFGLSVCVETETQNWAAFYNYTSAVLSDARGAKSFESCYCIHEDQIESREFSLHAFAVPGSKVAGQHFQSFEFIAVKYQDPMAMYRAIQDFSRQPAQIDGGAIIFNVGIWHGTDDFSFIDAIFQKVQGWLPRLLPPGAPPFHLLWKTITSHNDPEKETRFQKGDAEARRYLVQPWQLFDVRAITAQAKAQHLNLFSDPNHFMPIMYEEFNTLLLNQLCDESNQFA